MREPHGLSGHWLYPRWVGIIQRCTNPRAPQWRDYGGRGITVCERWRRSFGSFLADVGDPPARQGWSLERIDNDRGYEPGKRFADDVARMTTLLTMCRIARGWTQRELAERLGLKMQQIQAYEAGGYERASLERIRDVLRACGAVATVSVALVDLPAGLGEALAGRATKPVAARAK